MREKKTIEIDLLTHIPHSHVDRLIILSSTQLFQVSGKSIQKNACIILRYIITVIRLVATICEIYRQNFRVPIVDTRAIRISRVRIVDWN